ncbi:MAG: DUF1214 domain-containing protein [Bacteroidota bacterium]
MKTIFFGFLKIFKTLRLFWLSLSGKSESDVLDERVTSLKAWEDYCDGLKSAGAALLYPGAPTDPQQMAEGIRYLSRLTRAGLEAFVEYGDPRFPQFRRTVHETIKMGADNPDNYYLNAQISGEYDYIISGRRNSIDYFGLFTQNGSYGTTGGLSPCGKLEDGELVLGEDGSFEVVLSKERRGKNWLKIEADSSLLMVRQTYRNREEEAPVELSIEAIGVEGVPGSISPEQINDGLSSAALLVAGAPMLFSKWAKGFQKHTNELPLFDPEVSNSAGGDASIIYYHSHWKLADDEALVIEASPPECDNWNFQLNNYWMESLDYRYHNICINDFSAKKESDASIKVIVAHEDPGHANWIQTAGHNEGTMCWRWYRPVGDYPDHVPTRKVKFAELS